MATTSSSVVIAMTPPATPSSNTLLLQTILNHALWSTLHVAARYLQVYATPLVFESQTILSSTKGFAFVVLLLIGVVRSRIDVRSCSCGDMNTTNNTHCAVVNKSQREEEEGATSNSKDGRIKGDVNGIIIATTPSSSSQTEQSTDRSGEDTDLGGVVLAQQRRKVVMYTVLFASVSSCRASLNVASAKFTYPYNISEWND